MDNLIAARSQMGMSLAPHFIFAAVGVSLPLLIDDCSLDPHKQSRGDPSRWLGFRQLVYAFAGGVRATAASVVSSRKVNVSCR
jgi:hypothetical protein